MDESFKYTDSQLARMVENTFTKPVEQSDEAWLADRGFEPYVEFKQVWWRRTIAAPRGSATYQAHRGGTGNWYAFVEIRPDDDVQEFAPETTLATLESVGNTLMDAMVLLTRKLLLFEEKLKQKEKEIK